MHRLIIRSLSTVAMVVWAIRPLQVFVLMVPLSMLTWLIGDSEDPSERHST